MEYAVNIITLIQFFFAIVIGLYFWNLLKSQQGNKVAVEKESRKEIDKLQKLREISLSEPLTEKIRPTNFSDLVGQEDAVKALKAALCGANPQHVIVYGPPGVGKTAAARLILNEAKQNPLSPFNESATFTELDATTARFDERGIADPLIGTVHDPIYQGAGPLGIAGIPQPKAGAVTKAHGGILFIDEIGELHPLQMNKLLKVLEDRKVFLESSYYNREDSNIPTHIHDIFQNGLPADFRLVGATTRLPEDIPPAIRSRCVEIFFRPLRPEEIANIAAKATSRIGYTIDDAAIELVKQYTTNGREVVNLIQIAAGLAQNDQRGHIQTDDVEWVINFGQYSPRPDRKIAMAPQIGLAHGLAVYGPGLGVLMEIEVLAKINAKGQGHLVVTGLVEEEELGTGSRKIRRKSMAKSSVENVMTLLTNRYHLNFKDYDLHINFPSSGPVDGPSAGVTLAVALYSAMKDLPISNKIALTGEVSLRGLIRPVGGVTAKIAAAEQAGAEKVIIPAENYQQNYKQRAIEVVPVESLDEVFQEIFV